MLPRRLLLVTAFGPAAIAVQLLIGLPANAAANGAGEGSAWPAATLAVIVATLALVVALMAAFRAVRRAPRVVAILPVTAAFVAVVMRRVAATGAPEEFYLLHDARLWIVLSGMSVVLAALLASLPSESNAGTLHRSVVR